MNENAEDLAYGCWPDILMSSGMDASFFRGKAGPCPLCPGGGGKDRYRWVQKKYGGVWVCNVCTGDKYATGFTMLMRHMGYQNFKDAADHVRDFFGANTNVKPISREARMAQNDDWTPERVDKNRARMLKIWNEARELSRGDPVHRYMRNRVPGLNFLPQGLRFHPALEYWAPPPEGQDKPVKLGTFPAMLAQALNAKGELVQLHKTYLTPEGFKADVPLAKKTDLGVGEKSFAVRMMEPQGNTLGVCEGLETGWASAMLKDIPVWPCLNGPAMAEFELPQHLLGQIKTLVIFADSDALKTVGRTQEGAARFRRAGSAYAEKLAQRMRAQHVRTLIIRPAKVGEDMADYWGTKIAA